MAERKTSTAPAETAARDRRKPLKARLTDERVARHSNPAGKTPFLWDDGKGSVPGFGVRATEAGGKQYTLRYRLHGRQKSLSLGPVETFASVEDARKKAREKLEHLVAGVDPAIGGNGSMQAVWDHYIETLRTGHGRVRDKGRPASEKTIVSAQSAWRTHLEPVIADWPPKRITAGWVRMTHDAISKQRAIATVGRAGNRKRGGLVVANRTMAYLQSAWRTSRADGLTQGLPDPFEDLNRNSETARSAYLKKAAAPAFIEALAQEPDHYKAYWITMLMLGPRGGELRGLRRQDVEIDRDDDGNVTGGTIVFRDTKNGTDREIIVPTEVAQALDALPRAGKLVFPFTYPKASWSRICNRSGITGLRPHDVRRSVGSWLGAAGLSSKQVGALLGHKSDITSRVYIALSDDDTVKQSAAAKQAAMVREIAGNVVLFPTERMEKAKARRSAP